MEQIDFEIDFEIQTWDITQDLDVTVKLDGNILGTFPEIFGAQTLTFNDVSISEGPHELEILLSGMEMRYTQTDDSGEITDDVLLVMKNITIDGVPLDEVMQLHCVYLPEYPEELASEPAERPGVINLGHNGRWVFKFETPIYMWFLENH
jgi:hypothetical protein